jgi:hypothetical protein
VVDFILERTSFVPGQNDPASVGIHRLISEDTYKAAYPLHDVSFLFSFSLLFL